MRREQLNSLSFVRDERGSVSVLFAFMLIVLLAFVGAAVDYGKWHNAQTHIAAVTDRALLAAGRHLQSGPDNPQAAIDFANTYFEQEITSGVAITAPAANFKLADNGLGIEADIRGSVRTPFLSFINIDDLSVRGGPKVEFSTGGGNGTAVEVAIMLDVTGSMCDDRVGPCTTSLKLNALKKSAKDLVSVLVRDGQNAKVAVVPFSTKIRVGQRNSPSAEALMEKLTGLQPVWSGWYNLCTAGSGTGGSEDAGTWTCTATETQYQTNRRINPCVTDRTGAEEFTDAPPGPNAWLNAHDGHRFPDSQDSGITPFTSRTGKSAQDGADTWNYVLTGDDCADIMPANSVIPLSLDADFIDKRIDLLAAFGSTGGAMGTAWAWYVLSPNWTSVFGGESAAEPYSEMQAKSAGGGPKLRKIAVLMTDGDYNTYRGWKNANPSDVSKYATQICTNMKASGIEIFTVGFELDQLPASEKARAIETLEACGTDVQHFYNSLDGDQLQTAFRDIALKLSVMYLAK